MGNIYFALVVQDRNGDMGVSFPDVEGCFSAASNSTELTRNAMEALALHLEGQELPSPRSIAELKEDADVQTALSAGGMLMAVQLRQEN